jgi:putative membrane protein
MAASLAASALGLGACSLLAPGTTNDTSGPPNAAGAAVSQPSSAISSGAANMPGDPNAADPVGKTATPGRVHLQRGRSDDGTSDLQSAPAPVSTSSPRVTEPPEDAPPPGARVDPAARPGMPLAPEDRNFLQAAAQAGLLEIEAARLAEQRARADDVRAFAAMTLRDHLAANARLRALAAAKGLALAQTLDGAHQAKLAALEALGGTGFDLSYVREEGVAGHAQTVKLFEQGSISRDADIRHFAQHALPGLREQLKHARLVDDAREVPSEIRVRQASR